MQISGSYTDTERRRGLGGVGMGGRPQLEAASPDRQVLRRRADDSAELNSIQVWHAARYDGSKALASCLPGGPGATPPSAMLVPGSVRAPGSWLAGRQARMVDAGLLTCEAHHASRLHSIHMQKSVAELAGETTKAIGALAREIDAQGKSSKKVCVCVCVCVCVSKHFYCAVKATT